VTWQAMSAMPYQEDIAGAGSDEEEEEEDADGKPKNKLEGKGSKKGRKNVKKKNVALNKPALQGDSHTDAVLGRGFHSSASQLNLSCFCPSPP